MNDWNQYSLAEVCHYITDGKHGDCKPEPGSGYYFLSAKDVIDGKLNYVGAREITKEDFLESHKRTRLEANDILITNSGTIGRIAIIKDSPLTSRSTFQKSVAIIKPKAEIVNSSYLYYYLTARKQSLVDSAGGTTQQNLLLKDLRSFKVRVPPLEEQKAIATILSSLDDKIELNRRMNATLEAIAQALFKAWFVDFEPVQANKENRPSTSAAPEVAKLFPTYFQASEIGLIPEGWTVQSVFESAKFVNGRAFKEREFSNERTGAPVIKIAELKNGMSSQTKFTEEDFDGIYRIKNGDLLFSWSGSPETSIDIFIWTGIEGWLNQHIFKVLPYSRETREFVYWLLRGLKDEFIAIAKNKQTTGLGHVTGQDLRRLKLALPSRDLVNWFHMVMSPTFDLILSNKEQGESLSDLRDELLPRLISGNITVKVDA